LEHGVTEKQRFDALTEAIIGAAIEVHKALGPGLLESAYVPCLMHELSLRGLSCRTEVTVPVVFKGVKLDCGYRLDLLVEEEIVVELKAVENLQPVHQAQVITYLKLTGKAVGLLINFNVPLLKDGIRRLYNPAVKL
jgi:GxxExxY protein